MFDDIKGKIIGGVAVLVIGGTGFAVSQTDVISNFAAETGMSQEEASKYVDSLKDEDLATFTEIGQDHIKEGNLTLKDSQSTDCVNYEYEWESASLDCVTGKHQLETIGSSEVAMGECYLRLDEDLGNEASNQINKCIKLIDTFTRSLELEVAVPYLSNEYVTEQKKTNAYNKSLLKASQDSE